MVEEWDSLFKVDALAGSPQPTNVKQQRQFNGLAGSFRWFLFKFSTWKLYLCNLTKTSVKWERTEEYEAVSAKIIDFLTLAPLLTIFQEDYPVEFHTWLFQYENYFSWIKVQQSVKHWQKSEQLSTFVTFYTEENSRSWLTAKQNARYKQELLPRMQWKCYSEGISFCCNRCLHKIYDFTTCRN